MSLEHLPQPVPLGVAPVEAFGERLESVAIPAAELAPKQLRGGHELQHVQEAWGDLGSAGAERLAELAQEPLLENRCVRCLMKQKLHSPHPAHAGIAGHGDLVRAVGGVGAMPARVGRDVDPDALVGPLAAIGLGEAVCQGRLEGRERARETPDPIQVSRQVPGPPVPAIHRHRLEERRPQVGGDVLRPAAGAGDRRQRAAEGDEVPVVNEVPAGQPLAVEADRPVPGGTLALVEISDPVALGHLDSRIAVLRQPLRNVPRPLIEEVVEVDPRIAQEHEALGLGPVAVAGGLERGAHARLSSRCVSTAGQREDEQQGRPGSGSTRPMHRCRPPSRPRPDRPSAGRRAAARARRSNPDR